MWVQVEWGIFCKKNEGKAHNVRGGLIKLEPVAIFGVHDLRCQSNFSLPTHPIFRLIIHHYFPSNSFLLIHYSSIFFIIYILFILQQLNITLMYLRNAFIVDLEIRKGQRVLNLDSVAGSSEQWLQSNVLIFDTWHWWLHSGQKQPSGSIPYNFLMID